MNQARGLLALAVACGLIAWFSALELRLARQERQRLQLEARCQELVAQQQQTREQIETLQLSLLRADAAAAMAAQAQSARAGGQAETKASLDRSNNPPAPGRALPPLASRWQLPAEVDAALAQRFGRLEISEIQPSIHNGQSVYVVRGTTADARSVGAMVSADGAVLTSKAEVAAEALPENVTGALRNLDDQVRVDKAREIYSAEGDLEYALSGQGQDGRKVSLNIAADGRITSGELERPADELPEPVRNTVAQTVANRSPSSVLEVFGGKGTFYEIGFAGDSDHIQMVIDQQGRLVSFASKANLKR
jgi:hypothetical protein